MSIRRITMSVLLFSIVGCAGSSVGDDARERTETEADTTQSELRIDEIPPGSGPPGDAGGDLRVEGRITDEGVECLAMRSQDGKLYTLAGRTEGLNPGDRVVVTGSIAQMSMCMQGTTISVATVRKL